MGGSANGCWAVMASSERWVIDESVAAKDRCVVPCNVILQHAPRGELPSGHPDRLLHPLDPAPRNPVGVLFVPEWHDLVFEQLIQVLGVDGIGVVVRGRPRDRPAVLAAVPLLPPAID